MKESRCFESGNPLPKHVYRSSKWSRGDKSYRYSLPNRIFIKIEVKDEDEIVKFAKEASGSRNKTQPNQGEIQRASQEEIKKSLKDKRRLRTDTKDKKEYVNHSSVGAQLSAFLDEYIKDKKGNCTDRYISNQTGRLVTHLQQLESLTVCRLQRQHFKRCWDELSYDSQRTIRTPAREFVAFLIDEGIAPQFKGDNPFVTPAAGGFSYKSAPKKVRGKLTLESFCRIRSVAKSEGYQFLVDAMDIGFLTALRLNDVLTLRNDIHINSERMERVVTKSEGRKGSRAVKHSYPFEVHSDLRAVINRSRIRAPKGCPFIIHHNYDSYRKSKAKQDPHQVLPGYLNDVMNICMNKLPEFKSVGHKHRPSFHEVRALRVAEDKTYRDMVEISKDLGHTDVRTTDSIYNTHDEYDVHRVTYSPGLA